MPDIDVKKVAADILRRIEEDDTKDDAKLLIVYREAGAFRRVLADNLGAPKPGEKWFSDPSYNLTGSQLRALCEAAEGLPALNSFADASALAQHVMDYLDVNLSKMEGADCPSEGAEKVYNAAKALVEALAPSR